MKKIFTCLFCIPVFISAFAQGLLPNGDLEDYTSCPDNYSEIDKAVNWNVPTSLNSSEYFNTCSVTGYVGVPLNGAGYQSAHSGNGYAGIYIYYPDNVREYISASLAEPLIANATYRFSMYVSLADRSGYTTDAMGIYLSDTAITGIPYVTNLLYTPQVQNDAGSMPDTSNWMLVSADYLAHGGEQYVIIGNFNDDASTSITLLDITQGNYAYVFIDDFTVEQISAIDEKENASAELLPNPFSDALTVITSADNISQLLLYNLTGQTILQQFFTGSSVIETKELTDGIYLYAVQNGGKIIRTGKIVKL